MEDLDVIPLLSCIGESNHLRRWSNRDEVIDENTFSGKHILLCCINLPFTEEYDVYFDYDNFVTVCPHDLLAACHDLFFIREDFELVVVIKTNQPDGESEIRHCWSHLPSLSLVQTFGDSKGCDFIYEYHDMNDDDSGLRCVLVNSEKKLVCQGNYDTLSNIIDYLKELYRECSFDLDSPRCYERLLKSMWPVIPEEQSKPWWKATDRPIARKLKAEEPEYSDEIINKVLESQSQNKFVIEIGKSIDVVSLLCGEGEMNYLVRNNGERVEVEGKVFDGKYVMVCCVYVPVCREDDDTTNIQTIANICYELYATRTDVEVVVIEKMNKLGNHKLVFDHFLTGFPSLCLAVPFEDSKRREFICKYLNLKGDAYYMLGFQCLVLDKNGNNNERNILAIENSDCMCNHGANAFPFTKEICQEIRAKDFPICETPSTSTLEGLLCCSPSDVVYKVNSEGERVQEVTISELSDKVVGVFMPFHENSIPRVHELHEECKSRNLSFEIVLVCIPFDNTLDPEANKAKLDSILQKLNISSKWWRLPFNHSVSKRLSNLRSGLCGADHVELIIVGPHDDYVDPHGMEIMKKIGIDGYPFTRESVVQSGMKKLRELTLESLLVFGSRDYVYQRNDKIAVSELRGRNIILYLDHLGEDLSLYDDLLNWYDEIKAKDLSFEVVFVRLDSPESNIEVEDESELSAIMPWLICPFDPHHSASVVKKISIKEDREDANDTLVLFGEDGMICSIEAQRLLSIQGAGGFPFGDNLREEVINELRNDSLYYCMSGYN